MQKQRMKCSHLAPLCETSVVFVALETGNVPRYLPTYLPTRGSYLVPSLHVGLSPGIRDLARRPILRHATLGTMIITYETYIITTKIIVFTLPPLPLGARQAFGVLLKAEKKLRGKFSLTLLL